MLAWETATLAITSYVPTVVKQRGIKEVICFGFYTTLIIFFIELTYRYAEARVG